VALVTTAAPFDPGGYGEFDAQEDIARGLRANAA
jgi:hypothetical protein